jgi:dephospho-CoA kinase
MVVIGLTGGIACGKSTVSSMLAARGVAVVDADVVARDIVAPGTEGARAVLAAFGDGVRAADGGIDRRALAAQVFHDPARRAELNAVVHPRVAEETARRLAALDAAGHGFAVYDAALLVETGGYRAMALLVVVTATPEAQRARLLARNGGDVADADARIAAQLPLADKVAVADRVLDNSGSVEALAAQVDALYTDLALRYGVPARG